MIKVSKITITVEENGSKSSIIHDTEGSILIKIENTKQAIFKGFSELDESNKVIAEKDTLYVNGAVNVNDLVSRISKAECAITQINNKLWKGDK
jgi:hypothetical protein